MIRSGIILMIKDSAEKGKTAYAISKELGILNTPSLVAQPDR